VSAVSIALLRRGKLGLALVGAVAIVSLGVIGVRAGGASGRATASSGSPTGSAAAKLGLPTLGSSQVVETDDVGDPFVLTVPAGADGNSTASYVLYWTTDWDSNVPTAVSSDLVHWTRVADSLPVLPAWAVPSKTQTWGPAVRHVGDHWLLVTVQPLDAAMWSGESSRDRV